MRRQATIRKFRRIFRREEFLCAHTYSRRIFRRPNNIFRVCPKANNKVRALRRIFCMPLRLQEQRRFYWANNERCNRLCRYQKDKNRRGALL